MRVRRPRKQAAHLEITAFINLIVVLVPFLLSTAVFSRLAVLELTLPAQSSGAGQLEENKLLLEVVLWPERIDVGGRIGGLRQSIPNLAGGGYDVATLSALMVQLKSEHPQELEATILAQPDTPYDALVKVMDSVRSTYVTQGPKIIRDELFPNISIGDAPVPKKVAAR
ncbi:ExbD/TolR family protein [Rivibacter subsaxonicus]|uniref:Biopolymer transport protein ExbD n=1 Tax=Rivibacter subsaxonicus TaxID=457575 RepID=A0A4Q7W0S1_9BURK|nr:biopolymer transporter ExbD [Rivibacter subsaxonicus]RZU02791.1 biopolymer transport protein ExbD [Rivibacter subsaxonicus]